MRNFVYFSSSAQTSGKALSQKNLMQAGRMDIVIHTLINCFFLSHNTREDVKLHLIFYGMPDPPKHIQISMNSGLNISKKDIAGLLKKILYKYREGEKREVLPGCFVEKKSLLRVIEELIEERKEIFILDKRGKSLRKTELPKESVFVIGDHNGLPKKDLKRLKKIANFISVGPKMYFASQVATIINNELDERDL